MPERLRGQHRNKLRRIKSGLRGIRTLLKRLSCIGFWRAYDWPSNLARSEIAFSCRIEAHQISDKLLTAFDQLQTSDAVMVGQPHEVSIHIAVAFVGPKPASRGAAAHDDPRTPQGGYQRIRFSSGMAPSGIYWRCSITHSGNMKPDGFGIDASRVGDEVAHYSSGSGDCYLRWPDAPGRSARELGNMFLDRFPIIAREGSGRDWAYAGWLTEILGRAERDEPSSFPVFFADYPLDLNPTDLPPSYPAK